MKLKELGLMDFGKFHNRKITLKEGIHIIYGDNEAGKSTIHNFIGGVFYGFAKDSLARRLTDEDYERYRPWNGDNYRGYIEIEKEDSYRIERDFTKNQVKVYNLKTGLDLSQLSVYRQYSRIAQPGVYFLDRNRTLFENTVFLRQLENHYDKSSDESLRERIHNFVRTKDESLNGDQALDRMKKDLWELGYDGRKSSQIGSLAKEIKEINKSLPFLEEEYQRYYKKQRDFYSFKKNLKQLQTQIAGRKKYDYEILKSEVKSLEEKMMASAKNKITISDYETAIELNHEISSFSSQLDEYQEQIPRKENYEKEEKIQKDYEYFRKIQQKINLLNERNYSKELEMLSIDYKKTKEKSQSYLLQILLSLLGILLIIGFCIYLHRYFLGIFSIFFAIHIYLRGGNYRRNHELLLRIMYQMEELKQYSLEKRLEKQEYDQLIQNFFEKYHCHNGEELEEFFSENAQNLSRKKALNEFQQKDILQQKNKFLKLLEKIESRERELAKILKKYDVKNIAALRSQLNEKNPFQRELEIKKRRLKELEGSFSTETPIFCEKPLDQLVDHQKKMDLDLSRLKGEMKTLESSVKKLQRFQNKKKRLEGKKQKLEEKRELLELASRTLEELLSDNQNLLMPRLRQKMEEILEKMTEGKYRQVLLTQDYNISLYDQSQETFVHLSQLSQGTIDQVYLAFQLALGKVLWKEEYPLILDDPFYSYDDARLRATLDYLSREKQVMIFTSNHREQKILNEENIKYELITL
ncbi:MAG: AAA family ATPase [Tissierellia bacterium]|nr:AAA family ATPase [Tissierellia bacterium]